LSMQDDIEELHARIEQLTALLAAVQEASGARVFTADPLGGVHLGRRGRRTPLALPGRPLT
jgi:MerR family transcriptional regulator, heat shock protein HspR